ncbi:hypothetical protein A2823_01095 [Candidatus Nomurabacteria bacterium RIFCSPHIGHO2_01_FULL_41_91]|nr:MAG: hypothetical protein A2823_01095 [Candidatus Nomurabacteria bacterium RIFCSPHIGHO2_01_FULL_41_91]OGI93558.1 MAG: hypothetical protein A3A07_00990 [Candidatus Nomurabacteria bacterium RIFCSPLOWO2_01_FULL_41_52]OGI97730.1 MAG: hypothetical protein A3H56_02100 [Candidatus Nomurabacteria bacterium RIFCSPLOWO2_02_FULL_42_24]
MNILKSPTFTEESLEKHLSHYPNIGRVLNFKKLEGGVANVVYKIKTTKGNFVLKIVIRNNPYRVNYEVELLNKIKNLPIPKPLKARNGKFLVMYKKHQILLYPYLPGKKTENINHKISSAVGKFLAKLHLQTRNFHSKIKRNELYGITHSKMNHVLRARNFIINKKIKNAITYIEKNAFKYKIDKLLPDGAMHLDIRPENVLFHNGKLTGVVDFDNSYNGPLILDLAGALIWYSYENNEFNLKKMKQFYLGYTGTRKLSKKEKIELINMLHYYVLGIVLHGIEYYIDNKLSEQFLTKVSIGHLLEAEKKLTPIERKLSKLFK